MQNNLKKPFSYIELKAMCMLCATQSALLFSCPEEYKFKDEVEAREWLENEIDRIIKIKWDRDEKS